MGSKRPQHIMASRIVASRLAAASKLAAPAASRALSHQGSVAVERLRDALSEYRCNNYTRCIPSRFEKDIVKATMENSSGDQSLIAVDGVKNLIHNIRMDHKVSEADVDTIFDEIADSDDRTVPAD